VTLLKLQKNRTAQSSAAVWLLDGRAVGEDDLASFVPWLGASEVDRYAGFRRNERRRQFLLGRVLLRFAAATVTGFPPHTLNVIERRGAAPQLLLPYDDPRPISVSLSHSRNWISCAISSDAVMGVDVEVRDPKRDFNLMSQMVFHPQDSLWMSEQSERTRLSAFYHLWCLTEALFKIQSGSDRQRAFLPLVGANGEIGSSGDGWHSCALPHSELSVVLCSDRPLREIHLTELSGLTPRTLYGPDRGSAGK
jgi:4'-phosphopantetheinyl transferase